VAGSPERIMGCGNGCACRREAQGGRVWRWQAQDLANEKAPQCGAFLYPCAPHAGMK